MKKFIVSLCILCTIFVSTLFMACACDPGDYHLGYDFTGDEFVKIELINYDNPSQKRFISWVPDHTDDLLPFEKDNSTTISTLTDQTTIAQFTESLLNTFMLGTYFNYDSPKGLCIKITLKDGSFLIVNEDYYVGKYTADGEVAEFYGVIDSRDDFIALTKYFDYKN